MAQSIYLAFGIVMFASSVSANDSVANPNFIIPIGGLCIDGLDYCQGFPNSHCEFCFGCKSPPLFPKAPMFGTCQCNGGYVAGKLYGCLPVRGAGESCRVAEQCQNGAAEKDSDCVDGTCQCGEGFVQEGKFCFPETKVAESEIQPNVIIPIGMLCDPAKEFLCQGYPNSHCVFGMAGRNSNPKVPIFYVCECKKGYVSTGVYGCLPVRQLDEKCTISSQCHDGAGGPLSNCIWGKCRCQSGSVAAGKKCVQSEE